MPIEILLAPQHWPEELEKVRRAYAANQNARVVPVSFRTVTPARWVISAQTVANAKPKLPKIMAGAFEKAVTEALEQGNVSLETYSDEQSLRERVLQLLGRGRGEQNYDAVRAAAFRVGEQTVDGDTWQRLARACTPNLEVSHARWFGHGAPGRVRGEDRHNVDLFELARMIDFMETPIFTFYCCETGKLNQIAKPTQYWQPDAPRYILERLQLRAPAIGPVVINSCTTVNMWMPSYHAKPAYPFERHTHMGLGGVIDDVKTAKECETLMQMGRALRK